MADERDKYFIDLTVEQGQGLTKMEAMVKAMERLKTERKALNVAYREGLITENQLVKGLDRINVGLKGLSGRYREATNAASGLTNEGLRFRDKMAGAMTGALAKLGTQLAATFAVTRVISFFKSSIAQIENFEAAVSKLKGISRASGDEIERLTKLARELAAASKFTATQVVEAQTELAKLGLTVPQIEATTGAILQLATAADTGIANAAEIATQTMNQFNLTAAEMPRLVDIMARSFTSSALNIERWNASFKSVGATANAVGASVEDTAAAISALVDAGIPAEKAGTDLRNIYIELAAGGKTWKQAMDEIKNSQDKVTTAVDLFGKRSGAAGIILSENTEKLQRLGDSYRDSAGAAAELEKAQMDNLRGDKLILASAWEEFILSVEDGTGVVGTFARNLTQGFTSLIQQLTVWGDESRSIGYDVKRAEEAVAILRDINAKNETKNSRTLLELAEKRLAVLVNEQRVIDGYKPEINRVDLLRNELKSLEQSGLALERQKQLRAEINAILSAGADITKVAIDDENDGKQGILDKLQTELKLLRERRDEITEEEGGRNEILRINTKIEAKQKEIDDLLGKGVKKTKKKKTATEELNEQIEKYEATLRKIILLEDIKKDVEKRNTIARLPESEVDKAANDAVQEALDASLAAYKKQQEEKTRIAKEQADLRRDIEVGAIQIAADVGTALVDGMQQRANRQLEIELDMLEKMRQNNEISQEEYERVTMEARRRNFEDNKKARLAQVAIDTASAMLTTLANMGYPAAIPYMALAAAAGVAQAGIISAQQFAKGGQVQPLEAGKITGGQNIPTQRNGDNVLATVKTGEVILNRNQQAALGGPATFRSIGVPGFAEGGLVAPQTRVGLGAAPQRFDYEKMAAAFSNVSIETSIVEIMSGLSNQNKITELKRL